MLAGTSSGSLRPLRFQVNVFRRAHSTHTRVCVCVCMPCDTYVRECRSRTSLPCEKDASRCVLASPLHLYSHLFVCVYMKVYIVYTTTYKAILDYVVAKVWCCTLRHVAERSNTLSLATIPSAHLELMYAAQSNTKQHGGQHDAPLIQGGRGLRAPGALGGEWVVLGVKQTRPEMDN